jgi:hypothetical protein
MKEKNLNESIIEIRCELQAKNLKKSGKNKFAGFDYFELSDFLPTLNELMKKYKVNDIFTIKDGIASLTLILGEEKQEYTMPFVMFDTPVNAKYDNNTKQYKQVKSMQDIQYLGALNTYYKRYLYLNAFGITDGEIIDSMDNSDLEEINHRQELINYCNENNLNMNEIAVQYKLNGKSKDSDFKKVLEELKKEEQ